MSILSFEQPKKVISSKEHRDQFQSDTGIPGTYVPNMSMEDQLKWRAKLIQGTDPRIEIRKRVGHSLVVIVVRVIKFPYVTMSMNGKANFLRNDVEELFFAIREANAILRGIE